MKYLFIVLAAFLLYSCKGKNSSQDPAEKQEETRPGSSDDKGIFTEDKIGWTVLIPSGWEVETKEESDKNTQRGKDIVESTLATEIDDSGLEHLLNLKKDENNSFLSTMEKFNALGVDAYDKNNQEVYDMMKQTYAGHGINASYSEDTATIDGLLFSVFKVKVYGADNKEVILHQAMYSRLINGYDVGLTMTYNSEDARMELEKMIFSSKFTERN